MANIIDIHQDPVFPTTWDELVNGLEDRGVTGITSNAQPVVKDVGGGMSLMTNNLQSPNYKAGTNGWRLFSNGDVEFGSGKFRGDITIGSGNSVFKADSQGIYLGNAVFASAPFRVAMDGSLIATSATISGSITATTGTIGGWTIGATDLSSGSFNIQSSAERLLVGSATAPLTGTGVFIGKDGADYEFRVGNPADKYIHFDGTTGFTMNGIYLSAAILASLASGTEIAIQDWTFSGIFSSTDYRTVAWTSGDLVYTDGTTYSIDAGNTGEMTASTPLYIYMSSVESETVLQTSATSATSVGAGKTLMAFASPNTDTTSNATFFVYGGTGNISINTPNIVPNAITTTEITDDAVTTDKIIANAVTASKIAANTITASEIAANTITASEITANTITASEIAATTITADQIAANTITSNKMSVSTLSAIAADLGTITAGNMTLNASGYIKGGQTAYNTGTGFFLGYDTSAYKFSLGNPAAAFLTWDGTKLVASNIGIVNVMTAGESISGGTLPEPIFIGLGTETGTIDELNDDDLNRSVYIARWVAQTFTATDIRSITKVTVALLEQGTATGTFTMGIYATSGGEPTGSALATRSLNAATEMSTGDVEFELASKLDITSDDVYAIVLSCPDAPNNSNDFDWYYDNTTPYSGGVGFQSDDSGGSWTLFASGDFNFKIDGEKNIELGKINKCDDTDTGRLAYTGFATTTASADADIDVQFTGIVEGFTGLSIGSTYYLKSGAGDAVDTTQKMDTTTFSREWGSITGGSAYIFGQTFTTSTVFNSLYKISIPLKAVGSPTDVITCKVYANDKSTLIATSTNTIDGSTLTSTHVAQEFNFSEEVLSTSTMYFIELTRTTDSDSNYYGVETDQTTKYAGGSMWRSSDGGSNWTDYGASKDMRFIVSLKEAYSCGDIAVTAGINSVKVGRAISATGLLIYQLAI